MSNPHESASFFASERTVYLIAYRYRFRIVRLASINHHKDLLKGSAKAFHDKLNQKIRCPKLVFLNPFSEDF